MSTLAARHLVKQYGDRRVVDDISLTVAAGEVVGLLGPNGAGKTTTFYMILGLIACDAGTVHLDRMDLSNFPMHERARLGLGYLPQEPSIFRKLTVEQNILAILEMRREMAPPDRKKLLESLLQELHIDHLRHNLAHALSGGERRRVEIARALASEPQFILLDEPFAAIDPISVADINRIIRYLSGRDIGILITDHNYRETLAICDRGYVVNQGEIIKEGKAQEILSDTKVRDVYLGHDFKL
ncbi:MAG: LPS export ABC transporter ATP-binding protein [Pseudomonadota bacterium]